MTHQNVQNRGAGGITSLRQAQGKLSPSELGSITPPNVGSTSGVLPEAFATENGESSHTGVSTRNALYINKVYCSENQEAFSSLPPHPSTHNPEPLTINQEPKWYALRCTYGREKKSYEHLTGNGIKAFYPTITTKKEVDGKGMLIEESRLPNIFFAYGTLDELKEYVYDNIHDETKHLRFYYNHHHDGRKEPLVVPERQMKSLMLICDSKVDDIILKPETIEKFKKGQHVKVIEGPFTGVEGIVSRWCGQQRVGIVIEGLLTMTTAYVPTAFLKKTDISEHLNA